MIWLFSTPFLYKLGFLWWRRGEWRGRRRRWGRGWGRQRTARRTYQWRPRPVSLLLTLPAFLGRAAECLQREFCGAVRHGLRHVPWGGRGRGGARGGRRGRRLLHAPVRYLRSPTPAQRYQIRETSEQGGWMIKFGVGCWYFIDTTTLNKTFRQKYNCVDRFSWLYIDIS